MSEKPYQRCPDELRDPIWNAGRFTAHQFFRVAAWKSAQGLGLLTLNSEAEIAEGTENAIAAIRGWRNTNILTEAVDWEAWNLAVATAIGRKGEPGEAVPSGTGLLRLSGVGYPRATSFLAFLAPAAFPVIDQWTVKAIYGDQVYRNGKWRRAAVYKHFTNELVSNAHHFPSCSTVHRVDQMVMDIAMECERKYGHVTRPCSCYPTRWPVPLSV